MQRIYLLLVILMLSAASADAQFRRNRTQGGGTDVNLNYSNPAEYIIGGIEVKGLNILDKNSIISLTGLRVGDKIKIPGDGISGAVRKLWKLGLVGDVAIKVEKIEGENVFLLIELSERPRLTGYTFECVPKGQESTIREEINLNRGKIVNDALIRNTELAVKKYYVKKGFLNTEVKIVQERDSLNSDGMRMRIIVNPNAKVKINKIDFIGNENIPDGKLKAKMKGTNEKARIRLPRTILEEVLAIRPSKIKEFFTSSYEVSYRDIKDYVSDEVKLNFFNGSKLIKTDYEDDKNKVIAYYNSKGFRDAEILVDSIFNHDDRSININLHVYEGPKYYFRDIYWVGNYVYNDEVLSKVLDIQKGDVYNKELINKKLNFNPRGLDISGLYMDDGYLFFNIQDYEVAVEGDSIDIEMRIVEGDQATIDNVFIKGNDRTSDHVIRRELRTLPGQKFRRSDLIFSQQRLSQMGYFNPESINPEFNPNPVKGTVDITWEVEEQSNDQIELSGGWGGVFGFVGTLGLTFNNFSLRNVSDFSKWRPLPVGDGQRFSVRLQANGRSFQSYNISFTEPWLGGKKPQSLTVSYNNSITRANFDNPFGFGLNPQTRFRNFDATLGMQGITIGIGRQLRVPDEYFTLTTSLSYLKYTLENWQQGFSFSDGVSNSVQFNTTIARNSIDNPMYPGSGSSISLSLSLTPPYSLWNNMNYGEATNEERYRWLEFHKWMFDARYYVALTRRKENKPGLVMESKLHVGIIGMYNSEVGVGPFERFTLGGAGLAGGFASFLLGQEIIGLRGYEDNHVTPPYWGLNRPQSQNRREIDGGIAYTKFGLELRYPITTGQAATIYGLTFVEAGNNWNNYAEFNPFNVYRSAGFGARLFMPAFGLIGLNWAYGFDTLPGRTERSGSQFHFTIGQQIR